MRFCYTQKKNLFTKKKNKSYKHVSASYHVQALKHLTKAKSNVPTFTFSPNLFRVPLDRPGLEHFHK